MSSRAPGDPERSGEPAARAEQARGDRPTAPNDIVIVGPCASGKSTLAENLVRLGYHARVVGQEHSDIQRLWERHHPAVVIGLNASLETVRARRGRTWSQAVYERQQQRLRPAMAAATVILDTERLSPTATLAAAAAAIREAGIKPVPAAS